jgi:hypothetical protein
MRIPRVLCCAAVALMLSAPAVRADEFNKLTYLTFSGPVQVPGVVLPAGTYMFKLADPEGGRRVIQIWDQQGTKLYTMLLSISDQMSEPKEDPVVLFTERPSGEPQAIRSWFYPGDSHGYEFVYPKDQAMRIAQANNSAVLAQSSPVAADADVATINKSPVGRVNSSGQFEEPQTARASDQATPAAPPPGSVTQPSANRTESGVRRAEPSTTAQSQRADEPRAVGTSGQLPRTASSGPLLQLMAGLALAAAFGIGRLRRRSANPGA